VVLREASRRRTADTKKTRYQEARKNNGRRREEGRRARRQGFKKAAQFAGYPSFSPPLSPIIYRPTSKDHPPSFPFGLRNTKTVHRLCNLAVKLQMKWWDRRRRREKRGGL
jgi:hypothetical protein